MKARRIILVALLLFWVMMAVLIWLKYFVYNDDSQSYPVFPTGNSLMNITQDGFVITNKATGDTILVVAGDEFILSDPAIVIDGNLTTFVVDTVYIYIDNYLHDSSNFVVDSLNYSIRFYKMKPFNYMADTNSVIIPKQIMPMYSDTGSGYDYLW